MTEEELPPPFPLRRKPAEAVPPPFRPNIVNVLCTGHALEIGTVTRKRRKRLGLEEQPPDLAYSMPAAVEEVRRISESKRVDEKIGLDAAKRRLRY